MKIKSSMALGLMSVCLFWQLGCDMISNPFSSGPGRQVPNQPIPVYTSTRIGGAISHAGFVTENGLIIFNGGNTSGTTLVRGDNEEVAGRFWLYWQSKEHTFTGSAGAIAYESFRPEHDSGDTLITGQFGRSLDLGDVTLKYAGDEVSLFKIVSNYSQNSNPAINYSTTNTQVYPPVRLDIPFVSSAAYRFEASGSSDVAPLAIEVQAPGQLLAITSPQPGELISSESSLSTDWEGKHKTVEPTLNVYPLLKHEFWLNFCDTWDGIVPDHLIPLSVKPGHVNSLTISSDQLQRFLRKGMMGVVIVISQDVATSIEHGGQKFRAELRNTTTPLGLYFRP